MPKELERRRGGNLGDKGNWIFIAVGMVGREFCLISVEDEGFLSGFLLAE